MSTVTQFLIVPGKTATLLSRDTSQLLNVLRIGVSICSAKPTSSNSNETQGVNKKAALEAKYPKVFQGLGKLRDYQLKLHINESVPPVAQPERRIPFSRRKKVQEKLEQLEELDVIEKWLVQMRENMTKRQGHAQTRAKWTDAQL